jgi:hypothetical protein
MKILVAVNVLFVTVIISAQGASADMFSFLKRYDVFLCPKVEGRITLNGEPVVGVRVLREIIYDKGRVDTATTSGNGTFRFPELIAKSRTPGKAFDETRNRQVIVADHNGQKYLLWLYVTGRVTEEAVINEKLSSLDCDLSNEEKHHHFKKKENPSFTHNIKSICRWE